MDLFVVEEILLPEQSAHRCEVLFAVIFEAIALLGRKKQPTTKEQFEHRVVAMNIITIIIIFQLRRRSTIMHNFESGSRMRFVSKVVRLISRSEHFAYFTYFAYSKSFRTFSRRILSRPSTRARIWGSLGTSSGAWLK